MPRLHYRNYPGIKRLARDLRKNQTPSEIIVWNILRRKKISGFRFLRQHPIFYVIINNNPQFYIADFYCAELMLIIEIDGKIHENQLEYDKDRDEKISSKGIKVIKINNDDVAHIDKLTKALHSIISERKGELSDNFSEFSSH